ncbi:unnamed protein product [Phaedon cochleariae]|uniref:MADF domain-containing protein n=1 Tax=Phaedon cochleariae TaxID=80249 RepID=A0A9P0DWH9_PHACE|nr:unnamed protein product [Phaedon cochleariae]
MTERELDIEFFIEEIKQYPEIWNVSDENYHDRTKKRAAWTNICCLFSDNFEQKDDKERNEICNKFIKKWRNIKDTYTKSLKKKTKSGQAADKTKKYIYARQLSFLGSSGATTETQSSLEGTNEDEDVAQPETQSEHTVDSEESERPKYDQGSSLKRKRNVESALIDFMTKPTPTPPPASKPDPDRSFFESVLPSISKFDEDQKIEFRCEVLKLIKLCIESIRLRYDAGEVCIKLIRSRNGAATVPQLKKSDVCIGP